MRKKIALFGLCTTLVFSLFGVSMRNTNTLDAEENPTISSLKNIFEYYYGAGVYKKHTVINVNEEGLNELNQYFHAGVTTLERSTYYSKVVTPA